MMPRRSLACLAALLACAAVSAQPAKKGGHSFILPFPDCAHHTVTSDRSMPFVDLQSTLRFAVLPSELRMGLRIIVGESQYTIVVLPDKTLLTRCDGQAQQNRCSPLPPSQVSVADLFKQDEWTFVDLGFDGHRISVLIADVEVLVDDSWVATPGQESTHSAKVAFISLEDASLDSSEYYTLEVNLGCNSTHMPDQKINTHAPASTPRTDVSPAPYPACPLYHVVPGTPLPYIAIDSSLSLAVFPSSSMLVMKIHVGHALYKASVEGTMVVLMKCEEDGVTCKDVNTGGTKGMDLLKPNAWNFVDILLENGEITVTINHKANVMGKAMAAQDELPALSIMAAEPSMPTTHRDNYSIGVNVACNDSFIPISRSVTEVPDQRGGTQAPVVDGTAPTPSDNGAPVGIIVGVLVALLVIVAIAIIVSVVRKRRTMEVNQHTPLQEQQQAH
ncbi:uncharacterized protein LOC125027995 [Penaeus chinensis]|uniref:uncharacterized protein LOC125027995 n=1 Tax=Penaeus chinensis TaxID=139456 RepID=UPI001FB80550|nr:uncharacterized protein LOC125027995 [Penaeus chinensis]